MTSGYVPDANGHHDEKVLVDPATLSSGALTPTTAKVAAGKSSLQFFFFVKDLTADEVIPCFVQAILFDYLLPMFFII